MLELGLARDAALHEDAFELHVVGAGLERVDDGEGVFALVEVFAEAFCFCVLRQRGRSAMPSSTQEEERILSETKTHIW